MRRPRPGPAHRPAAPAFPAGESFRFQSGKRDHLAGTAFEGIFIADMLAGLGAVRVSSTRHRSPRSSSRGKRFCCTAATKLAKVRRHVLGVTGTLTAPADQVVSAGTRRLK